MALGAPPAELETVLRTLPLRVGVYVPDDLLEDWFAPGTGMDPVSGEALRAAEDFGRRFECDFEYDRERLEAVFWKSVPAM